MTDECAGVTAFPEKAAHDVLARHSVSFPEANLQGLAPPLWIDLFFRLLTFFVIAALTGGFEALFAALGAIGGALHQLGTD